MDAIFIYCRASVSQGNSLPIGTILPYIGELSKIPFGWYLCDGSNGTPNLQGMFLRGQGSQTINGINYNAGTVKNYQLDAIKDTFGKGSVVIPATNINDFYSDKNSATGVFSYKSAYGYRIGGDKRHDWDAFQLNFDMTKGQNTSNEFRPVNYTVYYIMRVK